MTLTIGALLQNRFRIDALLGQGGMGAVYRAHDLVLNRPCALKEMVPPAGLGAAETAQFRQQFRQEASVLANLSHPNLPRVTDYFAWGAGEMLVMDYVSGESLDSLIGRVGVLPEGQVLAWAGQLLDALAYCHRRGVIHRDIKPGNIVITPEGQAMLVDFGLVKVWNPSDPQTMTVMRGMGTPAYAPPEQYVAGAGHTDARSDLYSLGATLYHALTGREPPQANLRMADPTSLPAPRALKPALSTRTESAVLRAMELSKAQRFGSAEEMRAALAGQAPARRPRLWLWLALGLLGALLLAGGGYWLATREGGSTPTAAAVVSPTGTALAATAVPPSPGATLPATPLPTPAAAGPTLTVTPSATPAPSSTPIPTPGSAWADEVVAFSAGTGAQGRYATPEALLGAPDLVENPCCTGMLQLGKGGSVLLAFADNSIADGDGADLAVYGESVRDDFLLVEVSADGQAWAAFPKVSESPGRLDLADAGLDEAVYVRLTDLQPGTSTGAEVDAVVALHSGPARLGALPALPDAVARGEVVLREGPDARMSEVGQAAAGEALRVLGRSPVSGWVKVQAGGAAGWCPIASVGLNVSLGSYEVAQAPATPTPKVTPTPKAGAARTRGKDGMVMVYVPAGEFTMGSPDGEGSSDEHPQHKVTLDSFWIDRTEVTNDQYRQCVNAGTCPQGAYWGDGSYNGGSQPVVGVSWNDAKAYCTWAGARLPTEAEWEKAARGTDGRRYPWGDQEPDCGRANYYGCVGKTSAVGSYPSGASPYGALDMAGNAREWVSDWYDSGYYGRSPARDPAGPDSGQYRVLRGSSWYSGSIFVRAARRFGDGPTLRNVNHGFRCAAAAVP